MLQNDSRKVKKGDIFIALKGINGDGHDYIDDAINRGCSKVICEYGNYDYDNIEYVDSTKEYLDSYIKNKYVDIVKNLKLIGITGTNGKTTTSFLIYQALNKVGIRCAYIGTVGFYMDGNKHDSLNTTPDILSLYHMLIECVRNDIEYVVMEVSSQGLYYDRVKYLEFDYAVFTNLTQDHLDFHKTMDEYLKCKMKLFKNLKDTGVSIINKDDKYYKYFITDNCITYGVCGDYKISDIDYDIKGSSFKINNIDYDCKLIGSYNIYNMCVVIIMLELLNIDGSKIYNVVSSINSAPGRMEKFIYNDSIIVIDYAHTPDAVEKVIQVFKDKGRVITVIGCGGNRDATKRKYMGKIASDNSDYVIYTADNPRYEDSGDIIIDMIQLLDTFNYEIEINRKKAIIKGIQMLKEGDILLVLGKGHEDYQEINGIKYPFSDSCVINDYINSRKE